MEKVNYISLPEICPTLHLIFIGDSILLELRSFAPALCSLESYPERGIQYDFSGMADDNILTCYLLLGNSRQTEASFAIARSGAAATSDNGGLVVTGGCGAKGYLWSSEVLKENSWVT